MNTRLHKLPAITPLCRSIVLTFSLTFLSGLAVAQEGMSLEQLEELVAEQKKALEQAIADRESTAAQAEQVQNDLDDAEERTREVKQELGALCEQQEELVEGTFHDCMASKDS
ncbi:MAG: hypothetical protein AB8B97_19705 [Granulosicoccus sp.]